MAKNDAEPPIDPWHHGMDEDFVFVDVEQMERWVATVQDLERGDANAILTFLLHQKDKAIKPRLAKIIGRLLAGEAFPRDDGFLLRLASPHFDKPRGRTPELYRVEKTERARNHALNLMEQGEGRDAAIHQAAKDCGVTPAEVRKAVEEWQRWMSEE